MGQPQAKVKHTSFGSVVWRRFSCNAIAFDGLSALTQLTLLATEYEGSTQREKLFSQLARLTGLQHLSAPRALQADGGKVLPPATQHHTVHMGTTCSLATTQWHVWLDTSLSCHATPGLLPCS